MKRRYQFLIFLLCSYVPMEVVTRVVSANAYANVYPSDGDSISIPIWGATLNAVLLVFLCFVGLVIPTSGWWKALRAVPLALTCLWSLTPVLYWFTPNHYWISASYLLPLMAIFNVIYWSFRRLPTQETSKVAEVAVTHRKR